MVVSSAAPRPLPLTSAMRTAVRSSLDWNHVEVVAADFSAGMMHAGDGEMRKVVQAVRNERLLNGARDGKLLLEALALALLLQQARVIENAGGLAAEGVENLAVDGGEGGNAARIEIDDAEQGAVLEVAAGIGNGARGSVKRDGDHGAQDLAPRRSRRTLDRGRQDSGLQ
jgi:hypothetical protein